MTRLSLHSGSSIPQIGFGTYATHDPADAAARAIEAGYRHLDTAQMYGNEAEVGEGIRRSGIDRSELFVTTKLNNGNHDPKTAVESFTSSLEALGMEYVDLFLIHWPLPQSTETDYVTTWKTLIDLYESGRARAIGVSNFEPEHLERIIDATGVVPDVNQIEVHPYFSNEHVRQFCRQLGVVVEAWSPLGRGDEFTDPALVQIAADLGISSAQVILRWHIQRGDVVIPKSDSMERMRQNLGVLGFELSAAQMTAVSALDKGEEGRRGAHPNTFTG